MPCVRSRIVRQLRMRIRHQLSAQPTLGVRVDERRLNRTRTNQRHLHDDVVQMIGLRVQNRIDLRATLDLKRADRLAALNELVRLRIRLRQRVHLRTHRPSAARCSRTPSAPSPARRVRESRTSARRSCRDRPCRTARSCAPSSSARPADSCRAAIRREHEAAHVRRPQTRQPIKPLERIRAAPRRAYREDRSRVPPRPRASARCTPPAHARARASRSRTPARPDSRARAWRPARRSARESTA